MSDGAVTFVMLTILYRVTVQIAWQQEDNPYRCSKNDTFLKVLYELYVCD